MNELQLKYQELKTSLDNNKLLQARHEANLEKEEQELKQVEAELQGFLGTTDPVEIQKLLDGLEDKIKELTTQAKAIIETAGI